MQLPGMIGNREVHNIYARGANAQKTYANLVQKVIDGTASPDEVNQLRESIIQYGKAAQTFIRMLCVKLQRGQNYLARIRP